MLKKSNTVYFGNYMWWPERGLIHWEKQNKGNDTKDAGNYGTISIKEALLRLKALSDMVRNSLDGDLDDTFGAGAIARHQRFINEMLEVIKVAKTQGDPTDAEVLKHKNSRRNKDKIIVPFTKE